MTDLTPTYQAINAISNKINHIDRKLDNFIYQLNLQRQSDIDYIAMETGINLDQDSENEEGFI